MAFDSKMIRSWKKVYESDIDKIIIELKEAVTSPCVIVLTGEVGAGKTTFTRSFIGESKSATSPTYSIINEIDDIVHADLYRLESRDDIIHLEIPLYVENKNFFLVEWGRDYIGDLSREVGDDFKFYEIEIDINTKKDESELPPSRNFVLNELQSL